jgi:radical SAM superfamily enzyme YgiQ (UPF0313 family)
MKVLLIAYDNDSHIAYFPMGLAYVAAALMTDGHEVEIYEQNIYHYPDSHLTDYLNTNHFDAVGVGSCGGYYQYRKIKKICEAVSLAKNKPFFWMGGHMPSPEPEYFLRNFKGVDAVVIGEGEETCKEMLKVLENGKGHPDFKDVLGMAFIDEYGVYVQNERRPLIKDIDNIPYPAWDLFTMEHYVLYRKPNCTRSDRTLQMLSGRGCPFHCNFCYRMDSGFRPRSTQGIIDEIKVLKERYRVNYITFDDELLMSSVARTKEIAHAIIDNNLNIKFWCEGRLNYACKDLEMLKLLKEAGCVFINYGIESMDNGALERMHKNLNTDMIIAGIENTLKAGISPGLNIIFGNLDEDMECLKKDVDFLLKYDDGAQLRTIRPVTPYPGTELYGIARQRGMIKDIGDFYENKHTNSDLLTCNFTKMTDEEFYKALDWANGVLLENYIEKQRKANQLCLSDLYEKHNADFRGFRPV